MNSQATAVLVAIGKDRPGLANTVAHRVKESGCTFEDARMETLGSYFAMMMRVSGAAEDVAEIRERLPAWGGENGLEISTFDDLEEAKPRPGECLFELRVDAVERAGIVDAVTRALVDCDINVSHLEGRIAHMPLSGERRFILEARLEIPDDRVSEVWDALDATDLDYFLTPAAEDRRAAGGAAS